MYSTSSTLTSAPNSFIAAWTRSYLPCRSSQRGDSGIRVRSASPIRAGTAPRPRISRQSTVPAEPGAIFRMTSATT